MASLIEKSPCDGLLPVTYGALALTEVWPLVLTSVAPFRGRQADVDAALGKVGLGMPVPNSSITAGDRSILWTSRDQAFLIGEPVPGLAGAAALTDQSDGWAVMDLAGPDWRAALARLVAIDLRPAAFGPGQVARTAVGHMMSVLWCREESVRIMVFRSMAATAVHEIGEAMSTIDARHRA